MQLRKAFKVLDRAGTGFVTMEQFGVFLREMNININPRSLENCFVEVRFMCRPGHLHTRFSKHATSCSK
eukprot:SAG31_NODE_723_length_12568_cov_3.102494_6_plen_69_part_00